MQKIYFGAPGTGKSFEIKKFLIDNRISDEYIFRTTFHPEYTYNDFTGQLLPTVKGDDITYTYKKGIFTLALEKAYEDTSIPVYLIIEEMSRGNCAAIFGDIFQLLDREKDGVNKGWSEYFINNELLAKDIVAITDNKVKLPPNFNIFGTVNTSDQNVFTMDTAFKRRFEWEYVSTEPKKLQDGTFINDTEIIIKTNDGDLNCTWTQLYQALNIFITSKDLLNLGEDKQIGQFFIDFSEVDTDEGKSAIILNKLLHYLWFDISQNSFNEDISLFESTINSFKDLFVEYTVQNKIFSNRFIDILKKQINA